MRAKRQPKILFEVSQFLHLHHRRGEPLLVGVSGGPDSCALFCVLHALYSAHRAVLHVVHVDHRWRAESGEDAARLQEWLERYPGVIVHRRTVFTPVLTENGARQQRLVLFRELVDALGAPAVLLGHHADDQAETVFQRMWSGASLVKLAGLRPISEVEGLTIWRPLLASTKAELSDWLHGLGVRPFEDPTNGGQYCVRGVLREQVFPWVRRQLGRGSALAAIGEEAAQLGEFLDSLLAPVLAKVHHGPWGMWVDASEARGWHAVLQASLVRRFSDLAGVTLSRSSVYAACAALSSGRVSQVMRKGRSVYVDRGRLLILQPPDLQQRVPLCRSSGARGWQGLWQGEESVCQVPKAPYRLVLPEPGMCYPGRRSLGRWYNRYQVPRCLRYRVPVVVQEGGIVGEFLTGQEGSKNMGNADMISVGVGAAPQSSSSRDNGLSIIGL